MRQIFYGWVVAGAAFVVLFLTYGVQYSFGIFVPHIVLDLGWSRATLGAAFSLYGLVYMTVTVLSGRLTDRFGPRIVITVGGLLLGLGIISTSRATQQWELFFWYGIVAALGMSTAYIPCNMAVARWFRRKRGLAVGISSSGSSCGILVLPLLVLLLIESTTWRLAMLCCGAGLMLLTIFAARLIVSEPAARGLYPDGDEQAPAHTLLNEIPPPQDWSARAAVRTLSFWWFVIGFAVALVTMIIPFVHLPEFASDLDLSDHQAAAAISVIGFAALLGGIALGALGDRIGHRFALLIGFGAQVIAFFVLFMTSGLLGLFFGAALFGIYYGAFIALFPAVVAEYYGVTHAGSIAGLIVGGGGLIGSWGPAAAGYLRDTQGDYRFAFILCIGVAVAGILVFASLPRPRTRESS